MTPSNIVGHAFYLNTDLIAYSSMVWYSAETKLKVEEFFMGHWEVPVLLLCGGSMYMVNIMNTKRNQVKKNFIKDSESVEK